MDPTQLTSSQWAETRTVLTLLWLCVAFAIFSAANFWAAHAIIPSALATGSISKRAARLRPVLYAAGGLGLVAIVVFVILMALNLGWIGEVFPRYYQ